MNPEHNFRHAYDLPPMRPEELVGSRIDPNAYTGYGWIALILAFGILCVAFTLLARAGERSPQKDQQVIPHVARMSSLSPESIGDKGRG